MASHNLSCLQAVYGNLIIQNTSITNVDGLDNLSVVSGYFSMSWNTTLSNLTGLQGLSSVGGNLYIQSNSSLTSLSGLDNLTSVVYFDIADNSKLVDISALDVLQGLGFGYFSSNRSGLCANSTQGWQYLLYNDYGIWGNTTCS
jgi:hypothetical protein